MAADADREGTEDTKRCEGKKTAKKSYFGDSKKKQFWARMEK